ncbi:heme exporter protein CcmD [Vibrio ulleungensis]|jgi:heme exporter protein D|uniref:Heme exporter protein D n=1 Tax=Vibrio ulleungensis TaxID=2807619 RepID=A0ABS2HJL8_9VIBR|nr:heme exporter protein CcmD [Vibrio ulleungensis]MBM7036302.1 heme exporter protein CcmD [Vibrio ulleungensis]
MQFESFGDIFAMGGYAKYVWSGFAVTFLSMFALLIASRNDTKKILNEVNKKKHRQARIDAAKNRENTL